MRVRHAAYETGNGVASAALGFHRVGHAVAEAEIGAGTFAQDLCVAVFHPDVEAAAFPFIQHIARVVTAQLDVGKDVAARASIWANMTSSGLWE